MPGMHMMRRVTSDFCTFERSKWSCEEILATSERVEFRSDPGLRRRELAWATVESEKSGDSLRRHPHAGWNEGSVNTALPNRVTWRPEPARKFPGPPRRGSWCLTLRIYRLQPWRYWRRTNALAAASLVTCILSPSQSSSRLGKRTARLPINTISVSGPA